MTLSEALSYAKVPELPAKAAEGANDWLKAIVLVKKANNRTNYAVAINDGMGNPQVVADFGPAMVIREVMEVYPYVMRDTVPLPHFSSRADIIDYLVKNGEDREKMEALASDTFKNGNRKPDGRIESDRAKIKILLDKYAVKNNEDTDAAGQTRTEEVKSEKTEEDEF